MKNNFTYALLYILIVSLCCPVSVSGQARSAKKYLPVSEDKNFFYGSCFKTQLQIGKAGEPMRKDDGLRSTKINSLVQLIDSSYNWEWDTITASWEPDPYSKDINFIYDANNNLLNVDRQEWNGSVWINSIKFIATYNLNNDMTSLLTQEWNGSAWDNSSQEIDTYDASNNLVNFLMQQWNGSG